jgi:hypothetical protein
MKNYQLPVLLFFRIYLAKLNNLFFVAVPVVAFIPSVACVPAVAAVMLLLSSLLLFVDDVTAVSCIPAVAGISANAGVPLVPDVLTVAGLHRWASITVNVSIGCFYRS